jgi:hypothetical protein
MRNKFGATCCKCGKWVLAGDGEYLGWSEGIKDSEGHRRGSGHVVQHHDCEHPAKRQAVAQIRPGEERYRKGQYRGKYEYLATNGWDYFWMYADTVEQGRARRDEWIAQQSKGAEVRQ